MTIATRSTTKAGRKVGSRVKLTFLAERLYPQFSGKVGKITGKQILKKGDGLMRSAYRSVPYKIAYFVRFTGESRDYLLGADHLIKTGGKEMTTDVWYMDGVRQHMVNLQAN